MNIRYSLAAVGLVLGICNLSPGQPRLPPGPSEAVGWAIADLVVLPEADRPFQRYVWIPPWANPNDWRKALDFSINHAVSHARPLYKGRVIANGWMVAYDLRRLTPKKADLVNAIAVIDGIATVDPWFHVPQENTALVGVAVLAPALVEAEAIAVAQVTISTGAIYRADWFMKMITTTIDQGVYYDLRQIEQFRGGRTLRLRSGRASRRTALSLYLESRGVFPATIQALESDLRSAQEFSGVTGKVRLIEALPSIARLAGWAMITKDPFDEDQKDPAFHPMKNLLAGPKDRAREVIIPQANRLPEYSIFSGSDADDPAGIEELQDEVPPNVATDTTIPDPYTKRLQPAISCMRCHGPDEGYKRTQNDVLRILDPEINRLGLDVLADLGDLTISREEALDRLVGLYGFDMEGPDSPLGRLRRDVTTATVQLTGGTYAETAAILGGIIAQYDYVRINAEVAARELGIQVDEDETPLRALQDGLYIDPQAELPQGLVTLLTGGTLSRG